MSAKKEVRFKKFLGRVDLHGLVGEATVALLGGVQGHYRLGDVDTVRTSPIIRFEGAADNPTLIETLNTIYIRDDSDADKALRCAC